MPPNEGAADEAASVLRGRRPIADGIVRIGPCMGIPALLRGLGVDPATVMADAGLTLAAFDDPDNVVPYATLGRLVASCAQHTGLPDIGLRIGSGAHTESLGVLGALLQSSPDLRTALTNFQDNFHLVDRGGQLTFRCDESRASLGYAIRQAGVPAADQIADGALVFACNVLRAACGAEWAPTAVTLEHAEPADVAPYRRVFGRNVRFDATENAIQFPARWLAQPMPQANESARRVLEHQIRTADSGPRSSVEHMRRVLHMLVHAGEATEERLAHVFAMHRRTINRRLRAEGTTFRQLVDEVRFDVARHLLETTDLSVVRIAGVLSYADASAFTRAFRRWSQTTPAQWRHRHQDGRTAAE
jgi:AraC-like DNA-binding protein